MKQDDHDIIVSKEELDRLSNRAINEWSNKQEKNKRSPLAHTPTNSDGLKVYAASKKLTVKQLLERLKGEKKE